MSVDRPSHAAKENTNRRMEQLLWYKGMACEVSRKRWGETEE